jgi:hypothetical protein
MWFLGPMVTCAARPPVSGSRLTGPRPSTARQGRAQCRGSGRTVRELRREWAAPPPGSALDPIEDNSAKTLGDGS